jgi:hypothetical protein
MERVFCDIAQQNVMILRNKVTCSHQSNRSVGVVWIQGTTTRNNVSVTDSRVSIEFDGVSIGSIQPLQVLMSTVEVTFSGKNDLRSSGSAGVLCAGRSNVTFAYGHETGSTLITGSDEFPGVGAKSGECASIDIEN